MKLSLYELVDPVSQETKYVGISVNPKIRYRQHLSCKVNPIKLEWVNKLKSQGLKPVMNILDKSEDVKLILDKEIELISTLEGLFNIDKGGGFNYCTSKGERTIAMYSLDGEFLQRFSQATDAARFLDLNETAASAFSAVALRKRNYAHGYIWRFDEDIVTSEDIERLNYSLSGYRNPKQVYVFDVEGNFIEYFESIEQCSKELNISRSAITQILNNTDKFYQAGGYIFCNNYEEFENKYNIYLDSLPLSVAQYNMNGELLNYFKSINSVACYFDTRCNNTIKKCCLGEVASYKNFIFKYEQVLPSRCTTITTKFKILDSDNNIIHDGFTTDILRVRLKQLILEYPIYEDYFFISDIQPLTPIKDFLNSYKKKTTGFQVICNETGKIYDTCKQASVELNFDPHAIMKYLNGTRKSPVNGIYTFTKITPND